MRVFKMAAASLLVVLGGCLAYEPGAVSRSLADGAAGRIYFETADAFDFPDMIAAAAPARAIHGDLSLPEAGAVKGAAILSHGSGGAGARQRRMADFLNGLGYATFLLDHFGPRDVGSTSRDQLRVTAQMMLGDVFAARALLASHPRIPADRIGVIGWSKGGITALIGSVDRLAGYAAGGPERLAFSIAFYPFCGFDLDGERLATPLLMLLGEQDDWTPPAPCIRQAEVWAARGEPVSFEVYPGARHGFDSRSSGFESGSAITIRDTSPACLLEVGSDGGTRTLDEKHSVLTLEARARFLRACGTRGVTFGGNDGARDRSREAVGQFLDQLAR